MNLPALLRMSWVPAIAAGVLSGVSVFLTECMASNLLPAALASALWSLP